MLNSELSPKRYWRGPRSQEVLEERDCNYSYTVTTRMTPALRWAAKTAGLSKNKVNMVLNVHRNRKAY